MATSTSPIYSKYTWNPNMKRKALVIAGDFLDGRRDNDVIDVDGRNEVVLMALLYNLRIEASKYESYIFATMGNHDFYTFCVSEEQQYYYRYIHGKAIEYYKQVFETEPIFEPIPNHQTIPEASKVYFARNYVLARFYRLGINFFQDINDVLYAHAGFSPDQRQIHRITDGGVNEFHLSMLNKLLNPNTYIEYAKTTPLEPPHNYSDFYLNYLSSEEVDSEIDEKNREIYEGVDRKNVMHSLFLTRQYQKDCAALDKILKTYECSLLVVGHCPTCGNALGKDSFYDEDVKGIKADCSNARVVYSCGGSIITVDISLSYAFAAMKEFLEMLHIYEDEGRKHIRRCRHYVSGNKKGTTEYLDDRFYDSKKEKWLIE
jgi:hypothetical protein